MTVVVGHTNPPGRAAAPVDVKQRATKVARGCGRLLAHACASLLKFLRRSLIKRPAPDPLLAGPDS